MVVSLEKTHPQFFYLGVDILVQESLTITINALDERISKATWFLQQNSLDALPKLVEQKLKFDVVLLDGDHNYYTVSNEIQYIEDLVKPGGLVIVDDYDGKWSERDLYYSERPGYENIVTTARVETEKQGVKPAIDEWLDKNSQWQKQKLIPGEPILLTRKL